jgi:hypothetical protein
MSALSRAAAAVVVAVGSLLVITGPAGAAPAPLTTDPAVGRAGAAHWLIAQIGADGLVPSAVDPSTPDYGATAHVVLGLWQSGYGRDTATKAAAALAAHVDAFAIDSNGDNPANLALLILVAESLGQDPHTFGGTNLVARLEATARTTGPDAGLYGAGDPTYDGPFRQGLALTALSLVDPPSATSPPVTWLTRQECAEGSWTYRADTTQPCVLDLADFTGPDTNGTAMAVIGLHALGVSVPIDPKSYLDAARHADGGWSFYADPSSPSDPDSTGLVIAAYRALGDPVPADSTMRLLAFQFGCTSDASAQGSFWYPPFGGSPESPNLLATHDATLGLTTGAWPASLTDATWQAGAPADPCASTTTSTTAPTTTVLATTTTVSAAAVTTTTAATSVLAATADPPASASTSLAFTGSHDGPLGLAGVALIATGALAAVASIRLRRRVVRR